MKMEFQVKNATISKVYFQNCLWQTYQTLLFKRNKFAYSDKNLNGPFYKIKPDPTSRVNIKLNKTSWNNSLHCFLNKFWNNFCFSDHTSENQNALLSSQLESWTLWRHQLLKKAANLSWWLVMELFLNKIAVVLNYQQGRSLIGTHNLSNLNFV